MGSPPATSCSENSEFYSDDSIRASYRLIVKACAGAGLGPADADDLAQDLWEWIVRTGIPTALIATSWINGAVQNYVRRFRRRSYLLDRREGQPLEAMPEPQVSSALPALESKEILDHVASVLPKRERNLLALIRRGYSIAEAARMLEIPRGSRAYYSGRLIAYARREMKRRGILPSASRQI